MGDDDQATTEKRSGWDWLLHPDRGLQRVLALIITIGGVLGVGFLVYDRFIAPAQQPASDATPQQSAPADDDAALLAAVPRLETGVQYSTYTALLGEPDSREQLQDGYVRSEWRALGGTVTAYVDGVDEVVAYGVTAMAPDFTPAVPFDGLRLVESTFGDVTDSPVGYAGVYPPSAVWWFQELHGGSGADDFRQVLLGAGFASTAVDDAAALGIADLSVCLPYSPWESGDGCTAEELASLDALHITSFVVGGMEELEALSMAGASFRIDE